MKSVKVTSLVLLAGLTCLGLALVPTAPGQPAPSSSPRAGADAAPVAPPTFSLPSDAAAPSAAARPAAEPAAPAAAASASQAAELAAPAAEAPPSFNQAVRNYNQLQQAVQADPFLAPPRGSIGLPRNHPATAGYTYTGPGPKVDPEMAKWMEEAWKAEGEQGQLLAKYARSTDAKERGEIKTALAKVLERQFDMQIQQREREVSEVEARVKKLREMIGKRNKARETIVTGHLDQLLNEVDGMGWVSPTRAASGASPYSGMGTASGASSFGGMGTASGGSSFGGLGTASGASSSGRVGRIPPDSTPAGRGAASGVRPNTYPTTRAEPEKAAPTTRAKSQN